MRIGRDGRWIGIGGVVDICGGSSKPVSLAGLAGLSPFTVLEKFFLKQTCQGVGQHDTPAMIQMQTVPLDIGVDAPCNDPWRVLSLVISPRCLAGNGGRGVGWQGVGDTGQAHRRAQERAQQRCRAGRG